MRVYSFVFYFKKSVASLGVVVHLLINDTREDQPGKVNMDENIGKVQNCETDLQIYIWCRIFTLVLGLVGAAKDLIVHEFVGESEKWKNFFGFLFQETILFK